MPSTYELRFEPAGRRVRVEFNGALVADSARAVVLHETRMPPAYYFPAEDVRMELLRKTAHTTHCPFKGTASYWTVAVGDRQVENAVWAYEAPYREAWPPGCLPHSEAMRDRGLILPLFHDLGAEDQRRIVAALGAALRDAAA